MKNKADVLVDDSEYLISLTKLTGLQIKDVQGYISNEFGEPVFKLSRIILENGQEFYCEGEHDFPYLCASSENIPGFDDDTLNLLSGEEDEYDETYDDDCDEDNDLDVFDFDPETTSLDEEDEYDETYDDDNEF